MSELLTSLLTKLCNLQKIDIQEYGFTLLQAIIAFEKQLTYLPNIETSALKTWLQESITYYQTQIFLDHVVSELRLNKQLSTLEKQSFYLAALLRDIVRHKLPEVPNKSSIMTRIRVVAHLLELPFEIYYPATILLLRYRSLSRLVRTTPQNLTIAGINIELKKYWRLAAELNLQLLYDFAYYEASCDGLDTEYLTSFYQRCQHYQLFTYDNTAILEMLATKTQLEALGITAVREQARISHTLYNLSLKGRVQNARQAEEFLQKHPAILTPTSAHLYVTIGIPGSGKSTWLAEQLPQIKVVSSDNKRAELFSDVSCQADNKLIFQHCYQEVETALAEGQEVVLDATNIKVSQRSSFLQLAPNYNAYSTIVFFDTPLSLALARNQQRARQVPAKVIVNYFNNMELPQRYEAVERLVVTANN